MKGDEGITVTDIDIGVVKVKMEQAVIAQSHVPLFNDV